MKLRPLTVAALILALVLAEAAMAQDSTADLVQRGTALAYATNVASDGTREGLALLEQAADAGDSAAMVKLGEFYLYGIVLPADRKRALTYFERAASVGDGSGLAQYGAMLMWDEIDWKAGRVYMERAAGMGVSDAWATLAEGAMYGYLGGGRFSRAQYGGYAEKARAAGVERIELLEAERQMWGISVPASGKRAVALLVAAADAGNATAARYLIPLVRDGNGMNIARDPAASTAFLERFSPLLTEAEIWAFKVALQAKSADKTGDYASVADLVYAQKQMVTLAMGADLYKASPRSAIFILQRKLKEEGFGLGAPDGFAGSGTLKAIYKACMKQVQPVLCKDGVMQSKVIAELLVFR